MLVKKISLLLFCSLSFVATAQNPKEIVKSIYFGGGSFYIDDRQSQSLEDVVKSIKNIEYYEISIMSHTDNVGGREFNEYLSRMRSQAAIELLKSLKVPQEIIRFKDFAFDAPSYDNNSWEGRARNRRVDILFQPITF